MATPTTATFAVELQDKTSGPASDAASALSKLRDKIDGDTKALREMQAAMKRLQGGTSVNVQAFRELQGKIEAQKSKIAENEAAFVALGGSFDRVKRKKPGSFFDDLKESAAGVPGPLGGVLQKMGGLSGLVAGGIIAAGIFAIGAALVALTAAAVATAGALARYGLAQADARRNELLRLEGLTKLRRRYGQVAGSATEMQAAIDRASGSTALGRGKVEEYASHLYRAGLRGENLNVALEAMAIRGSVLGDRYAHAFAGMAAGAARTGRSVRGLADDVKARLGGLAARQMLSLEVQSSKLHENLNRLFGDLRIEGFLGAINEIGQLFSQSTATGRALKTILETLFNPLFDAAGEGAPLVKRFFQGMVIAAQKLVIAILRVRLWFKRTFGDSEILSGMDKQRWALVLGKTAFFGLAFAIGATVAALALLAFALLAPWVALFMLGMAIGKLTETLWNKAAEWKEAGVRLVDGLVQGIRGAVGRVTNAVKGLARAARDALARALQIRSPSRVFANLGLQIPAGLAAGVERGAPIAEGAVSEMVEAPSELGAGRSSSSVVVSIGDVHVHGAGEGAAELARSVRDELLRLLEGAAVHMGAPA